MVASSVVTTIMVLNYHHRLVDTHEMPDWVSISYICFSYLREGFLQVQLVFLQWMPWLLRMSRPGEKITRKTIQVQKKMKELDKKELKSKSLLANVLDMDDDFHPATLTQSVHPYNPSNTKPILSNNGLTRYNRYNFKMSELWKNLSWNHTCKITTKLTI